MSVYCRGLGAGWERAGKGAHIHNRDADDRMRDRALMRKFVGAVNNNAHMAVAKATLYT
jgi:hypothetical protein